MTDDGSLANQVRGLNPKAWVRVPNAILLHPGFAELRGSSVKVWLVVAAHRNRESGTAFPSRQTIAKISGVTVPTVARALKQLDQVGMLVWESARGQGCKRHNIYRVPLMDSSNGCASDPIQAAGMGAPLQRNRGAGASRIGAPTRHKQIEEQKKEHAADAARRLEGRRRRRDRYVVIIGFATDDERAVIRQCYRTVGELAADDPLSDDELFGARGEALCTILARIKPPETSDAAGDPPTPLSARPQISEHVPA